VGHSPKKQDSRLLTLKRVTVLTLELLIEAILLGSLMGVLISNSTGLQNGIIGSILSVPVILALHGYYISRVISVMVWSRITRWFYPLLACFVFICHTWYAFWQMKSSLSPFAESKKTPFLIGGACIVFACAYIGTMALEGWLPTRDSVEAAGCPKRRY
jgi:hypothetical protein